MSSLTTLARPYAKAAFELANSDCNLAAWDNMLSAAAVVTADVGMAAWLQSPHSTASKAIEIIVEAMGGVARAQKISVMPTYEHKSAAELVDLMSPQLAEQINEYATAHGYPTVDAPVLV